MTDALILVALLAALFAALTRRHGAHDSQPMARANARQDVKEGPSC